jgi:hypothetical protein
MSFSAAWLALREPYDHAARASELTDRLCAFLAQRATGTLRILDLACGAGSTFRYLAPRIGGSQHWTMVDNDEALLALVADLPDTAAPLPAGVAMQAVRLDLSGDLARVPLQGIDVVTASALLDLVSGDWLDRAVPALGSVAAALLFTLSYDGSMDWEPGLPDDSWATDSFNRHQRTDKGFGPALGKAAVVEAAGRLRTAGFTVIQADSPWLLGASDRPVQREIAAGVAGAVGASLAAGEDPARLQRWHGQRLALIEAGRSSLRVGHTDLLALPGSGKF